MKVFVCVYGVYEQNIFLCVSSYCQGSSLCSLITPQFSIKNAMNKYPILCFVIVSVSKYSAQSHSILRAPNQPWYGAVVHSNAVDRHELYLHALAPSDFYRTYSSEDS